MENGLIIDISSVENGDSKLIKSSLTFDIPNSFGINNDKADVFVDGTITRAGNYFIFSAECTWIVHANCSSCLSDVTENISFNLTEKFSQNINEDIAEWEDTFPIENKIVNLSDAVYTNLLLSIPIRFSCAVDCKGLCMICGTNRNLSSCHCLDNEIDERFNGLNDFFEN